MEQQLLEAVNEMNNENFNSFDEAKRVYSSTEILDSWLRYEGIYGYTDKIKTIFQTLNL